jgi:hypothetical protein
MDKSQTLAACVKPSVRATIVSREIGGRRETAACAISHPKPLPLRFATASSLSAEQVFVEWTRT